MSFPTRLRRAEDLWSVCLFRGVQKGASSLIISLFGHSGCVLSPCLQRTAADAPPVPCISMRRLRLQPRVLPNGEVKPESAARLQPPGSAPFSALAGTPAAQGANSGPGKSSPRLYGDPLAVQLDGWQRGAGATAIDASANRLRRNASSSSSSGVAPAILNQQPFLTLAQSSDIRHLLNYHIFREFGEGGEQEGS